MAVQARSTSVVDIIIPVYGAMRHVRSCVWALSRWTDQDRARLIVVDDASDAITAHELGHLVEDAWSGEAMLLRNERNLGFLPSANRGLRAANSDVVVLLNSDAIVAAGWLGALQAALFHAPDVGIVSPLSNNSNLTTVRAFYGADNRRIADAVRRCSARRYPEIGMASGFCMAMRRQLADELGGFDARYGRGYFEETDFSLRAHDLGWRTVADDATYVHHHGWSSFGVEGRNEQMVRNLSVFEARWGEGSYQELRRSVLRQRPFGELESRVASTLAGVAQVLPRRRLPSHATRVAPSEGGNGDSMTVGLSRRPTYERYSRRRWEQIARTSTIATGLKSVNDDPAILLVATDLELDPWATTVLRRVDALLERDVRVSLAVTGRFEPDILSEPCRTRPFVLEGPDELLSVVPSFDLVIALDPHAVYDALLLRERDRAVLATWFGAQSSPARFGWPVEGAALLRAHSLAQFHLLAPEDGATSDWLAGSFGVPLAVCGDTYTAVSEDRSHGPVLVPHHRSAGPAFTDLTARFVRFLQDRPIPVSVYGHAIDGLDVEVHPFSPQEDEAQVLREAAALVEIGPVPGLVSLRLRAAATRTATVIAGTVPRDAPLQPGEHLWAAPVGDIHRTAELAERVRRGGPEVVRRITAAATLAAASTVDREVELFRRAVEAALRATVMPAHEPDRVS